MKNQKINIQLRKDKGHWLVSYSISSTYHFLASAKTKDELIILLAREYTRLMIQNEIQ